MKQNRPVRLLACLGALLLMLCCSSVPTVAAETSASTLTTKNTYANTAVSKEELTYYLYLPTDYSADKEYALLVYFHGEDGFTFDGNEATLLNAVIQTSAFASNTIVMVPVCNASSWVNTPKPTDGSYDFASTPQSDISKLVDSCIENEVAVNYHINKSTVYLAGYSMGGTMVWDMLYRNPSRYACAMIAAGGMDTSMAEIVKNVPMWLFHSKDDKVMSIATYDSMYQALETVEAKNVHLTTYDSGGHDIAKAAFSNSEAVEWLLTNNRTETVTGVSINDLAIADPAVTAADETGTAIVTEKPAADAAGFVLSEKTIAVIVLGVAGIVSLFILISGFLASRHRV